MRRRCQGVDCAALPIAAARTVGGDGRHVGRVRRSTATRSTSSSTATEERVRLIGIDTPETHVEDGPPECFGPEASAFTAGLLPAGTAVRLERDVVGRDDYGRLLAYVHRLDDGLFVNLAIVHQGYATAADDRAQRHVRRRVRRRRHAPPSTTDSACGLPARGN